MTAAPTAGVADTLADALADDVVADIVVVGSLNLDVSVPVSSIPVPGETVLGGDALWSPGGKGANQAVAAARLGRRVAMVGCVGNDDAGSRLLADLDVDGVDRRTVRMLDDVPTGLAMIAVDPTGENVIVVSPGANARVGGLDGRDLSVISTAAAVLVQFEVPLDALVTAAQAASGIVIVNPAPAPASADAGLGSLLDAASVIVPNRGELASLLGRESAESSAELEAQALALGERGCDVVVTLGADGVLVVEDGSVQFVEARVVDAIDATAAGDSFCGALADALVDGASLADAASWANRVASVTVTRRGAQASLPTRDEVLARP